MNQNNMIYNFNNCHLGDLLYYKKDMGYNLKDGEVVGECCIEAGTIDENARFWSINEITDIAWKKLNESNIFGFRKLENHDNDNVNPLYGHYGEWKKDNDGWNNTKILQEANSPVALKCKAINNNMYVPSANELHEAAINLNVLSFKINSNRYNYWTSTNYNKDNNQACILQKNEQIGMGDYYTKKRIKPFIHIVNEALMSFDNDDSIFTKSNNVAQTAKESTRDIRLKLMDSSLFIALLKNNIYDDGSIKGFKFNNTYFNGWPIYIKFVKELRSIKDNFYNNLINNKWYDTYFKYEMTHYLNDKYGKSLSDDDILKSISDLKYSYIKSKSDIDKIYNDPLYNDCEYIFNMIYNDYFKNISPNIDNNGKIDYKLSIQRILISPNKDFFCIEILNLYNNDIANIIGPNNAEKDFVLFGYTSLADPKMKNEIEENKKGFKKLKKCIELVFGDYNEECTEKSPIKLPDVFYPEIINGELAYTYNLPIIDAYSIYHVLRWDDIIEKQLQGDKLKKLRSLLLYKMDISTIYINDTECKNKLTLPETDDELAREPICIKIPYECTLLCALYYVYIKNDRYIKITIFDNTDFHIADRHTLIDSMVLTKNWCGWRHYY